MKRYIVFSGKTWSWFVQLNPFVWILQYWNRALTLARPRN